MSRISLTMPETTSSAGSEGKAGTAVLPDHNWQRPSNPSPQRGAKEPPSPGTPQRVTFPLPSIGPRGFYMLHARSAHFHRKADALAS